MSGRMMSWVRLAQAAICYFILVFGAGVLLGSVRVFWLEPRIEKSLAVLCEAPFLVTAMVLAARWVLRKLAISRDRGSLAIMGLIALLLQQIADISLGVTLRGLTLTDLLRNFLTPQGAIYAVLLVTFAAVPQLINDRSSVSLRRPQ